MFKIRKHWILGKVNLRTKRRLPKSICYSKKEGGEDAVGDTLQEWKPIWKPDYSAMEYTNNKMLDHCFSKFVHKQVNIHYNGQKKILTFKYDKCYEKVVLKH